MKPSSLVAIQDAPSKTALQNHDSHAYSALREESLACESAMCMCHLSVTLSIEFANSDTAQKAHYQPNTDNRSDNRCITILCQCHLATFYTKPAQEGIPPHSWGKSSARYTHTLVWVIPGPSSWGGATGDVLVTAHSPNPGPRTNTQVGIKFFTVVREVLHTVVDKK